MSSTMSSLVRSRRCFSERAVKVGLQQAQQRLGLEGIKYGESRGRGPNVKLREVEKYAKSETRS